MEFINTKYVPDVLKVEALQLFKSGLDKMISMFLNFEHPQFVGQGTGRALHLAVCFISSLA
jgi:hypothetical protein